jgi:prolyl-tRNA synthetase
MSERLLGAIVAIHGDDKGLIMPPSVAPVQVVVIPILSKDNSEEIMATASKMVNDLKSEKIRVKLDDRDIRPGQKYYDWEIKGVPIRIELGPRDLKSNSFMCARRTGEKSSHSLDDLLSSVKKELDTVSENMKEHADNHFNQHVKKMPNIRIDGSNISFEEKLEDKYVYEMAFGGNDAEAEMIEKETGFSFLGESMNPYTDERKCIVSGKPTTKRIFLAKSY